MNEIQAYEEILEVLEKHSAFLEVEHNVDNRSSVGQKIQSLQIGKSFGIKVPMYGNTWYEISEYEHIGLFGKQHNRTIGWSVDGRQPVDEWLYKIGFCTGAYIFGGDYPTKTFEDFFAELKTFKPTYTDDANHSLYFTKDNAKHVHKAFGVLFKKYQGLVHIEQKAKRVIEIKAELEKLTS